MTSLVHPYCLGCLPAALHLTIKVSTLRKAGRGLFACDPDATNRQIVFAKGEFIAPYLGEPITLAGLKSRYFDAASDPGIEYVSTPYVAGNGRLHFDGALLRGPAVYCNDARGTRHRNTACIRWNARGAPCLYATADIANGQEIFTGYGAVYWAAHQLKVETVLV